MPRALSRVQTQAIGSLAHGFTHSASRMHGLVSRQNLLTVLLKICLKICLSFSMSGMLVFSHVRQLFTEHLVRDSKSGGNDW